MNPSWCCRWSPGDPIVVPCHAIVLARLAEGDLSVKDLYRPDRLWGVR